MLEHLVLCDKQSVGPSHHPRASYNLTHPTPDLFCSRNLETSPSLPQANKSRTVSLLATAVISSNSEPEPKSERNKYYSNDSGVLLESLVALLYLRGLELSSIVSVLIHSDKGFWFQPVFHALPMHRNLSSFVSSESATTHFQTRRVRS